ncbi:TetR/AcrR family transcriptional regulator [Mycolicibacterium vaccae]|jgi:AcrR family transcriptional regulator|nr:TetR/AcrR family transcriptional regulator [Mycolicibacterium vaccae]ANI40328.1 TetR family transcriptional regulator [Mycolicibacterium vaccae 95051]
MPEARMGAADAAAPASRRPRVDAQRNRSALLAAAKVVFAAAGVDAPAKDIADRAGVGVGTLYRHFPQRADLAKAVLDSEIDDCAQAGPALSAEHEPGLALQKWLLRYTAFLATKDGLASALASGSTSFDTLRNHILDTLEPTLRALLDAATADGQIRPDVGPRQLMYAVAKLCLPAAGEPADDRQKMVAVLLDGLRYGA